MCSICGIVDFCDENRIKAGRLEAMNVSMRHRGPDDNGLYINGPVGFAHNRLAVMDVENGKQPMSVLWEGRRYTIVYNGEIYNTGELKTELEKRGVTFRTSCDTEAVLYAYAVFGGKCAEKLNGIFAFAVHDEAENKVFFARDRFGVKPFFYAYDKTSFLFASEVKGLLAAEIPPELDLPGLWQLLYLSPATIPGSGIFRNIYELKPAEQAVLDDTGLHISRYWSLPAYEWKGTPEDAAEQTKALLDDAITRQLCSDVPLCVLLSGGLDSSAVTAIAAEEYKKRGERLSTYSFEYEGNKDYFKKSLFQPENDDDYAVFLACLLGTDHTILTATNDEVAENLLPAALHRDFPGQADIDSSLLYFCKQIKKKHTVGLSGECSDELFGGYPWFYRPEMLYSEFFPWIHNPYIRAGLFDRDAVKPMEGYSYMSELYRKSLADCPVVDGEPEAMRTSRHATWLSMNYFMTSLLERKDRMSMASGVEIRVPFADHRLWELVYNIPWEIKFAEGIEKRLLREAMRGRLPENILWRKKSPYPKTHNPEYAKKVRAMLDDRLKRGGMLSQLLNKEKFGALIEKSGGTWLGQLMDTPQLIAWLVQFDYWSEAERVKLIL